MSGSGQTKQIIMIVMIIAAMGVSAMMIVKGTSASRTTSGDDAYFYDLSSGQLFAAAKGMSPPIDAPGGADKGVRAVVLGCGSCEQADRRIGYLETLTDAARAGLAALKDPARATPQTGQDIAAGTLVALPPSKAGDEPQWVVKMSPAGREIVSVEMTLCGHRMPQRCTP